MAKRSPCRRTKARSLVRLAGGVVLGLDLVAGLDHGQGLKPASGDGAAQPQERRTAVPLAVTIIMPLLAPSTS